MCLFPLTLSPKVRGKSIKIKVPCGKCIECLELRTSDWTYRMKQELKVSEFGVFLTLTYDDIFLPDDGVRVDHVQKFIKRLRKHGLNFKYYCIGEYGTQTFRPHYHMILFLKDKISFTLLYDLILSKWTYGFITMKQVTFGRMRYCVGYLLGQSYPEGKNKPFTVMSKRPSIGIDLLSDRQTIKQFVDNNFDFYKVGSKKVHIPRYYRKKLNDIECDSARLIEIRCKQCLSDKLRKLEYCEKNNIVGREKLALLKSNKSAEYFNYLRPFETRRDITPESRYNYYIWDLLDRQNKDKVLKQRSKKLRND